MYFQLKLNFGCGDIEVQYMDDEQDLIPISSEDELKEAMKVALKSPDHQLQMIVRNKPTDDR